MCVACLVSISFNLRPPFVNLHYILLIYDALCKASTTFPVLFDKLPHIRLLICMNPQVFFTIDVEVKYLPH